MKDYVVMNPSKQNYPPVAGGTSLPGLVFLQSGGYEGESMVAAFFFPLSCVFVLLVVGINEGGGELSFMNTQLGS